MATAVILALGTFGAPAAIGQGLEARSRDTLDRAMPLLSKRLGMTLPGPVGLKVSDAVTPGCGKTDIGCTTATRDDHGAMAGCQIIVRSWLDTWKPGMQASVIAHEAMHCFQFAALGTDDRFRACPAWVCEGANDWGGPRIAEALGFTIPPGDEELPWGRYLTSPGTSLFARDYDAIGFWSHLEYVGRDVWPVLPRIWQAPNSAVAFAVAIDTVKLAFLSTWASSLMGEPTFSRAWTTEGPGLANPSRLASATEVRVASGRTTSAKAAPMANGLHWMDLTEPVLRIDASHWTRVTDGRALDAFPASGIYCVANARACDCPGAKAAGELRQIATPRAYLALTGGPDGAMAELTAMSAEELCDSGGCPMTTSSLSTLVGRQMYYVLDGEPHKGMDPDAETHKAPDGGPVANDMPTNPRWWCKWLDAPAQPDWPGSLTVDITWVKSPDFTFYWQAIGPPSDPSWKPTTRFRGDSWEWSGPRFGKVAVHVADFWIIVLVYAKDGGDGGDGSQWRSVAETLANATVRLTALEGVSQ